MSKLFKLKEWLTVPDAARHLSGVCGEPVTEADVLRLGLDGHLTLSVHLVNHARARMGSVVSLDQAETKIMPAPGEGWNTDKSRRLAQLPRLTCGGSVGASIPADVVEGLNDGTLMCVITDINLDGQQFLHLDDRVVSISGVWDLAMIGAEALDVEHAYQQMTGGPEVTLTQLDGVFVKGIDGEFAQLQEPYDSPEMKALSGDIAQKLQDLGVKRNVKAPEKRKPLDHPSNWFPAGGLPQDSVIVVRTSALAKFQASIAEAPKAEQSSQSTREKNNLLRIIGLMANHRYAGDVGKPFSIATHLVAKADELSVKPPSDDAIAKHIKAALELLEAEKRTEPAKS
jgi:hypothetical protein